MMNVYIAGIGVACCTMGFLMLGTAILRIVLLDWEQGAAFALLSIAFFAAALVVKFCLEE